MHAYHKKKILSLQTRFLDLHFNHFWIKNDSNEEQNFKENEIPNVKNSAYLMFKRKWMYSQLRQFYNT